MDKFKLSVGLFAHLIMFCIYWDIQANAELHQVEKQKTEQEMDKMGLLKNIKQTIKTYTCPEKVI